MTPTFPLRVALAAVSILLATATLSDPLWGRDAPLVPSSVSAVATGGYWESGEQHGMVRVIVVQQGFEEVSSRVFVEWLEESSGGDRRVHRRVALDAPGDGAGWSVDVRRLLPSEVGLTVELAAKHAYSGEERGLSVLVRGPGDLVVERDD